MILKSLTFFKPTETTARYVFIKLVVLFVSAIVVIVHGTLSRLRRVLNQFRPFRPVFLSNNNGD